MKSIGVAILFAASLCIAQDTGNFQPAVTNVWDASYPRVDSSSRVEISGAAPSSTW